MENAIENEDESAKPLLHPPAGDMLIKAQPVPVEQLDHTSPTHSVLGDHDEPNHPENGILLPSAAPNVNNVELKSSPQRSQSEIPSSDKDVTLKCSLQQSQTEADPPQSQTEAALTDNMMTDPPQSQTGAVENDTKAELRTDAQQLQTETVRSDKSPELKTNAEQPQSETVLDDKHVELKTGSQHQSEAASNDDNMELKTPQAEAAYDGNAVNLTSSPKQHHTEAASSDRSVELKASPQNPQVESTPNCNGMNLSSSPKQHPAEEAPCDKSMKLKSASDEQPQQVSPSLTPLDDGKSILKPESEPATEEKPEANETFDCKSKTHGIDGIAVSTSYLETSKPTTDAKLEPSEVPENKSSHLACVLPKEQNEPATPQAGPSSIKTELDNKRELKNIMNKTDKATPQSNGNSSSKYSFLLDDDNDGNESGTEEEQWAFMKELENFFRERSMEFKPPKFYGEGLNCLKLWRAVMRLGGYDKVTSCKLWRQVGESFKPPKTCTTVSWTFRGFYEKALLDYERHKTCGDELNVPLSSNSEPMSVDSQAPGSGRARRDAAARAMQGWHSQRLLGNGEVSDPIIKDKNSLSLQKREKQLKSLGLLKRKKPSYMEHAVKAARTKTSKPQLDVDVIDLGPPADWVKINVQRTKDCFEVYALVPGLLREEQSLNACASAKVLA
ncbi:AT-rich interactive domain-containing protein 3 isoform X2 [Manihot esculenta]|uniref:AT-rich interactive domain-containing protein 3 isoform X2 n=1 Tax=Manihot esculenta TaxID=3983 RepID=UPI001CC73D37|nr:AT-rich interactive domain-containing protein 3 isoform X2 [Manihot esculenta]